MSSKLGKTIVGAVCLLSALFFLSKWTFGEPANEPTSAPALGQPPQVHGMALGLFSDDPNHDYEPQLREIAALGSTHVAVVVTYFQRDVFSTEIYADQRRTPSIPTIRRTLRQARELGLQILLFPYVRVDQKLEPHHWRGTLDPRDQDAWFQSYTRWISTIARIAAQNDVEILSLGSEMSSMDVHTDKWVQIIEQVRTIYSGRLTYSANWDHYDRVEYWDRLDLIGLTGYFELVAPTETDPSLNEITEGWREWYVRLMRWQAKHGRPLLMTEVGYRSNDGAAAQPWRWGQEENTVDLDEQRQAYEAFCRVWSDEARLYGVFFWNWWGEGGRQCHDYTPRRKPAEAILRSWFAENRAL